MGKKCSFCEYELPGGCYGMAAEYKECPLDEPKTLAWKVGRAIWDDLTDRRGVKHELEECSPEIQAEIVLTMGRIAMKVLKVKERP